MMPDTGEQEKSSARLLWFLMGFLSIGSQVILLRAAMVTFSGNEMIIGPMLFAWTIWTGIGSLLGGRWTGGTGHGKVHILLGIAAILLPATYFTVYLAKVILGTPPAFLISPVHSFLFFIFALAPQCFILGTCFAMGCRLTDAQAGTAVARTYLWDALGAAAGCLAAGGLLLPVLSGAKAVFVLAAITLLALGWDTRKNNRQPFISSVAWFLLAALILVPALVPAPARFARNIAWRGYPVITERDSKYANLMMVHREDEYTLFVNGAPAFTYPGGPADETLAYLALSLNPKAKRVLLIGGGLPTVGTKLLDGPIQKLDYCQIDPVAIEMEKLIPSSVWKDPRVSLHIEDGRQFIRNASPGSYDLVVLDVGDPDTLAQNRYYTVEFFQLARKALAEDGVLIFGVGEYANYISNNQALFLLSLQSSLFEVFQNYAAFPLTRFYLVASSKQNFQNIPNSVNQVIAGFKALGMPGKYFRLENLPYDLAPDRYKNYGEAMNRVGFFSLQNFDYWPIGYAYRTTMWLSQFPEHWKKSRWLFSSFTPVPLIFALILITIIQAFLFKKEGRLWGLVTMIFGVGFAGMAVEIMLLYAVQINFGALYGYIGYIVTIYMVGLSLGAWLSSATGITTKKLNRLKYFPIAFMLLAWMTYGVIEFLSPFISKLLMITILTSFTMFMALLSGYIFGRLAMIMEEKHNDAGKLGGLLNFADLAGTAISALLCPILMLPRWGFKGTYEIVMVMCMATSLAGVSYIRGKAKKT